MEQIMFNGILFFIGAVFGAGSFYGLVQAKLNGQKEVNRQFQEQLKELNLKLDCIRDNIFDLVERISRLEGKINGKLN